MEVEPAANEIGGDVRLEIGEGQDEIGLQREDLVDIRRGKGADARLLTASLRRAHNIAGDPDDAVLLAEQIQRFDGLFGKADNSSRRKHRTPRARVGSYFSVNFPAASASAPANCSRNLRLRYCSPPRHSAQQSEVDVVADVIRPGDDAVI
jgi:hypothetical protein